MAAAPSRRRGDLMKKIAALTQTTLAALVFGVLLALPASAAESQSDACASLPLGEILAPALKIDFGNGEPGEGDVSEIACKAHPVRPALTIVALFYRLKDARGEEEADKSGFALAVIDPQQRILHQLYRDIREGEATMRSHGGLTIDTARYQLKPGVRAFGVRMSIGWGPRCADGGWDNFLTLFVEEGKRLTPVMEMLPMSTWSFPEGNKVCGDQPEGGVAETTELSLALASSTSGGWRDLDVIAHTKVDAALDGSEPKPTARVAYRLRKNGKLYSQQ